MSNTKTLYGTDTISEIMKKETMAYEPFVSPNQKYSAHEDPRQGVHKDDELYPNGKDRPSKNTAHDSSGSSERAQHAMGGVAKHRLDYPDTDGAVSSDRGD